MERFEKIVEGFDPLTIFAKRFILDVWQGSEYATAADAYFNLGKKVSRNYRGYSNVEISSFLATVCSKEWISLQFNMIRDKNQ